MNRVVSANLDSINAMTLPAVVDSPPTGRRVRALFISYDLFGIATMGRRLEDASAVHDDLEAVHIRFKLTGPLRHLGRSPRWWPLEQFTLMPYRFRKCVHWRLRGWFNGPLPLDRFDVVHGLPPEVAFQALKHNTVRLPEGRTRRVPVACMGDSTAIATWREFEQDRPRFVKLPSIREDGIAFRGCDLVAGWSRWAADSMIHDHQADPAKVRVVPPGVRVQPANPRAALRAAATSRQPRIVFVGNDFGRKGGPRLVRWHQERWADRAELHIFSREAVPDPAAKNIIWHGPVENTELTTRWLPTMDLFVMPTREDVAGVVIAEAQAAGLPVVSSRKAGIPSLMRDGVSGILAEVHDDAGFVTAVERLLDDPSLLEQMGAAAHAFAVESLDTEKVHRAWLDGLVAIARNANR